jgi:hypothetical protein
MAVRAGQDPLVSPGPLLKDVLEAIDSYGPTCVSVREILERLPQHDPPAVARLIFEAITRGIIRARIEPVKFDPAPGEFPKLDLFRMICAAEKIPLVDIWHVPCAFPDHHYELLGLMDGGKSLGELEKLAKKICPELNFRPWIDHLASRGMFVI